MAYMNVEEIESALQSLAQAHPDAAELVPLPNLTSEGRQSHALRVGPADNAGANTLVITGGLHAREWVPPDALVNLAADLLEAHAGRTGLRYGQQRFSADDIKDIVGELQLVVFPCVNPDGRHHTQSGADPMWRKNRRRVDPHAGPNCIGVDINRNFDALWDFRRHFASNSGVSASADPCDFQVYVGPAAASEAETRNVVALLDRYPRTRWFVDLHSHVPATYYSWGFDENQSTDPTMNFQNSAFDGKRGAVDNVYKEFIPTTDLQALKDIGALVNAAVAAANGDSYDLSQSFALYPTSGTSDDYAYTRHFTDNTRSKILSFTIECGHSFQPTWADAENVIREVCAGFVAFCVAARGNIGA